MQGDTDPKSQYKHQAGEQQGLARKDLPDEPSSLDARPQILINTNTMCMNTKSDPSSTDEIKEKNEDLQNSTALTDINENQSTSNRYQLTINGLPLSIRNRDIKKFLLRKDINPHQHG